jgi:hypothetical protein
MSNQDQKSKPEEEPEKSLVPQELIIESILIIRGQKVLLDSNLAMLYGIETGNLNKAVQRNIDKFPVDFMFQLTKEEYETLRFQIGRSNLRSQIATSKFRDPRGGRRFLPYAFTEHGALMAATVLNSPKAVAMSVIIIRTFINLRNILMQHKDLRKKLEQLEAKYDENFSVVFKAIRKLMEEPKPKPELESGSAKEKKQFGFSTK